MKKGKVGFENKGLVVLLGALGVAIVGLIVGIAVVSMRKSVGNVVDEYAVEEGDDISDNNSDDIAESIREEIETADIRSADDIIAFYQRYIDDLDDDDQEMIVELLNERIYALQSIDDGASYSEQVIQDTIEIDNILQNVSSAAQVVNAATEYGEFGIADEYTALMETRELEEGVDVNNLETQG